MEFGLGAVQALRGVRVTRYIGWVGFGFIAAFGAILLAAIGGLLVTHDGLRGWTNSYTLGAVIGAFFIGTGALLVVYSRSMGTTLSVDESGFRIEFSGRHAWTDKWSNPRLRLEISRVDWPNEGQPEIQMIGRFYQRTFLTEAAFGAMVDRANAAGLRVSRRQMSETPPYLSIVITHLTG